jgi:hypothetical protein
VDCSQSAPIHLGGPAPADCAASLAAASLRRALCTCDILAPTGQVITRSFDSSGATGAQEGSAPVGANGGVSTIDVFVVDGALDSAGRSSFGGQTELEGSLRSAGAVVASTQVAVAGSAWVAGDVTGPVAIEGTLHQPPGAQLGGGARANFYETESVQVDAPCPCRPQDLLSIPAIVAAHERDNRNADVGLDFTSLQDVAGDRTVTLDCGEYYVDGIHATGVLTLQVRGRVALHVDGAVNVAGGLPVVLAPGAELDLVVSGDFSAGGPVIGDPSHPARVRIWIQGQSKASFRAPAVGALIYAPTTDVGFAARADLYGAALAHRFILDGSLTVRYDRALLAAGNAACGTPVPAPIR